MPPSICTEYLGLQLTSPILVGACPLTVSPERVRELAIAGAGAIVLPSLFEEQVIHSRLAQGQPVSAEEEQIELKRYDCAEDEYNGGPGAYLDIIATLKRSTGLPIVASLYGSTGGPWLSIASQIQYAGADALEVFLENDMPDPAAEPNRIEDVLLEGVSDLCDQVSIPVAVKLSPYHSNLPNLGWRLAESGASGIVCFAHDPIWQVIKEELCSTPNWQVNAPCSVNPTVAGLVRMRGGGPALSLAASGGVRSPEDVVRCIQAGADVVMIASEIYRTGVESVAHMVEGLCSYLQRNQFASIQELVKARPTPLPRGSGSFLRFLKFANQTVDDQQQSGRTTGDASINR
ncbi:MAG: hypothetical protein KDB22_23425 [Planctomycetales bacterium]|nr:hypothetical protein [Planctomycetales bacterium]